MANILFNIKDIYDNQVDDLGYFINTDFNTPNTNPLELISVPDFGYWVMNKVGLDTNIDVVNNKGGQSIVIKNDAQQIVYQKKTRLNDSMELELVTTIDGQTRVQNLGSIIESPFATYNIPSQNVNLPSGTYTISYGFNIDLAGNYLCEGIVGIVENHYPIKKWTITDVINRAFDIIEPLDYGQKPRFRLSGVNYDIVSGNAEDNVSGSTAKKLNEILSPEFSFTKMTLREQLQQVGGFIHAEPRIKRIHLEEKKPWFEVDFDKYGSNEKAVIKGLKKPVTITLSTDINNYATKLDSSADNLVNQLDFASGVVVEPYFGGAKSLRCETTTVRMGEDNNTFISTTLPIYKIKKVIVTYVPDNDEHNNYVGTDITPYIFEKADYDNLSSYSGTYPYAKSYALYYTQGQKNIRGLFFKNPDAVDTSVFSKYSIINILRAATGNPNLSIVPHNYYILNFNVEYIPLYSTRIQTNKQTIISGLPRSINYNQSANVIESRYYGENLKGVIARLGNVEKFYTYNLAFISDIPKIGTKFDENYYISTVATEFLPSYIKCTVGLSKDFNRLSEYVGISSNKRMWEVSEKQSQLRDSIHTEYILITEDKDISNDLNSFLNTPPTSILNYGQIGSPVSVINIATYSKKKKLLHKINLPIVSSSFGNSITFTCSFNDNYSAGQSTTRPFRQDNGIYGTWGINVPYGDYYGRVFYLYYELLAGYSYLNDGKAPAGWVKHEGNIGATVAYGKKYRKDSRETIQLTFELSVVTDNEKLIIGSALAKNCSLVNQNPKGISLYAFKEEINKIDGKLDLTNAERIGYSAFSNTKEDSLYIPPINTEHVAWALVTDPSIQTITVEDEDGGVEQQKIQTGGELVLGQNESLVNGKTFYFRLKKDIYN